MFVMTTEYHLLCFVNETETSLTESKVYLTRTVQVNYKIWQCDVRLMSVPEQNLLVFVTLSFVWPDIKKFVLRTLQGRGWISDDVIRLSTCVSMPSVLLEEQKFQIGLNLLLRYCAWRCLILFIIFCNIWRCKRYLTMCNLLIILTIYYE